MAIVQVSRITNRKGLAENLPQLAGAELGWAIDLRRLYIGNGTLQDGAPEIGNTEILTEFSDILAIDRTYTYEGLRAGYAVQTGATSGSPVSQSLQTWLDSFAIVTDFGAVGDGVTDDTEAINRALFQLYCREVNPQIRRSLFFPAGRYRVIESINIPSYAKLYGEGANSSVIFLDTSSDISSLSAYCARYADSLQQTGVNIGNNGAIPPTNIEISSMGFEVTEITDVFAVDAANYCSFNSVSFRGPLTTSNLTDAVDNIAAIRFDSTLSLVCTDIVFSQCEFTGLTWAVNTAEQLKGITFRDSRFDTLYQGILLGDPTPINGGPSGVRITGNTFDNIYVEAIRTATGVSLNTSSNNIFYDVGNHFNGTTNPAASVIYFGSGYNNSVNDMFQRSAVYAGTYPMIETNNNQSFAIDSGLKVQTGTYQRVLGTRTVLTNNTSNVLLFPATDASVTRAIKVDYTIIRSVGDSSLATSTRTGTLTIVASSDGTGSDLSWADNGVQNTSTGVTFTISESAGEVSVYTTTSNTGVDATISYSITTLG